MTPHYTDHSVTLHHGDCLDILRELPDQSVDAVVTDPPYGISFMGKDWDRPRKGRSPLICEECGNDDATEGYRVCSDCLPLVGDSARISDHGGRTMLGHVSKNWSEKGTHSRGYADNDSRAFQQWCELWATECLRVLKPGGHMLAFGGTRTFHRLACAVEDAGFEIRDSIAWLYGSGFPKSLDVSKAIDKAAGAEREVVGINPGHRPRSAETVKIFEGGAGGRGMTVAAELTAPATDAARQWQGWGTALKPAFEPVVVARKPLQGTVAGHVQAWGTGALNVDGCRIGTSDNLNGGGYSGDRREADGASSYAIRRGIGEFVQPSGRWPANVILDESQSAALDQQSGELTSGANPTRRGSDKFRDAYGDFAGQTECTPARGADSGGASRFFYTAKADTSERIRVNDTAHPTVKPLTLMRWLVRLVTPPGGTVLEPFAGSGTTVEACILEGFSCIAIERETDYLPLIVQRVNRQRDPIAYTTTAGEDLGLFGLLEPEEQPARKGRWPANVVMDRSQAAALDQMSGERPGNSNQNLFTREGKTDEIYGRYVERSDGGMGRNDSGGASRFFFVTDDAQQREYTPPREQVDGQETLFEGLGA